MRSAVVATFADNSSSVKGDASHGLTDHVSFKGFVGWQAAGPIPGSPDPGVGGLTAGIVVVAG